MNDAKNHIISVFTDYLKKNKLRKTPERISILKRIYGFGSHFSVEQLYRVMSNEQYGISLATLYNTVELLCDCNLLKKHQFKQKRLLYEKSYKSGQHDHLICESCGKIIEFCDPRLFEIQKDISELYNFKIAIHELYLFGTCSRCQDKNN